MKNIALPAIWLIVLIVGLPQLTETVYSPSLPEIADDFAVDESLVEYTLTIYLFGFAVGTLFWGIISDKLGRKPCVILGMLIFIIGCIGCYLSNSIESLMIARFVQAFGGSIGSVLGQSICRDAFHGKELGKVYSIVGSSTTIFPALGPVIGGLIAANYHWSKIFLFLVIFALIVLILIFIKLPETHPAASRSKNSLINIILTLAKDRKVIGSGLIVAGCNGLMFSYFAEGSFFLIDMLEVSPVLYGASFLFISFGATLGGIFSKKMLSLYESNAIIYGGLLITLCTNFIFSIIIIAHLKLMIFSKLFIVFATIINQFFILFAICMIVSNVLSTALSEYKWCIGAASSFFGFFYYIIISLFTFIMGTLHNDTLMPMPLYFLSISIFMIIVKKYMLKENRG